MGSNLASELTDGTLSELGIEITLEQAIGWHLQGNHYPPVPLSMVQPCIEAIEACNEDEADNLIELPQGISWRGLPTAPAHEIVEQHHLQSWVNYDYDAYWDSMEEN